MGMNPKMTPDLLSDTHNDAVLASRWHQPRWRLNLLEQKSEALRHICHGRLGTPYGI